jgi:predicted phosphoribosyltransferase
MVARRLGLPVDLLLSKKIGHPRNKEYAIGAANLTDHFVIEHNEISPHYIQMEIQQIRSKLTEMYKHYMGDTSPINLEGKTVIVVDDGIATGNTILGTVNLLRKQRPMKIVVAAPVASRSAVDKLLKEVDEVAIVDIPEYFTGVGAFYDNFEQVEDEEVLWYLSKLRENNKNSSQGGNRSPKATY